MTDATRREVLVGAGVVAAAGLPVINPAEKKAAERQLMMRFCSLGYNCELGIAQRTYGAEPLDLFRWASTELPVLERLLRAKFAGIGEDLKLELTPDGEYMVVSEKYHFQWHSWVKEGQLSPEQIIKRESARLPRMAEMMMEYLTDGKRIFVRIPYPIERSERQEQALLSALHEYGNSTLMIVDLATPEHPFGDVERVGGGLLRAYIDRFSDGRDVAGTTPAASWLRICGNAAVLVDS